MTIDKSLSKEYRKLDTVRSNWDNMYQIIGEYVSQMKMNFTSTHEQGTFLIADVYDSAASFAAQNSASALLGMLWPGSASKSIEIIPPDDMKMTTELSSFFGRMNQRTIAAFDDPAARLMLALDEYMLDQIIFGTSGVGVDRGKKSKLVFLPYGVKECRIVEGENGSVDKIYILNEWNIHRIVSEYGNADLPEKMANAYKDDDDTKTFKILTRIRPRTKPQAEVGVLAMPYESKHVDFETGHVLREGGFEEFPIPFARFRKLNYETYGRCGSMNAMPDIKEANILREAIIEAVGEILKPAMGVIDDGSLGGGVIDRSAGAMNVFNASYNNRSQSPVFPISMVGDISIAEKRLEQLHEAIAQHYYIDRLLDFNNQTEMTLGEVQIRDQIRSASLSALFSRQIAELFTPLLTRAVNILWRDGEFGIVPGSDEEKALQLAEKEYEELPEEILKRIDEGKDVYQIRYKTKAASAQRAEDYMAILEILNQYRQDVQINPELLHRINIHEVYKQMAMIRGIPNGIVVEDDAFEASMKRAQEQQQQAMAAEKAETAAGAIDKLASADQKMREE